MEIAGRQVGAVWGGDGKLPMGSAAADLCKLEYCVLSLFGGIHGTIVNCYLASVSAATHCRYRVYTKFLLTYTAIYWRNRKVLPLGITAFQPQSHFHLGTPYISYL